MSERVNFVRGQEFSFLGKISKCLCFRSMIRLIRLFSHNRIIARWKNKILQPLIIVFGLHASVTINIWIVAMLEIRLTRIFMRPRPAIIGSRTFYGQFPGFFPTFLRPEVESMKMQRKDRKKTTFAIPVQTRNSLDLTILIYRREKGRPL